jgi:hypothetical protein
MQQRSFLDSQPRRATERESASGFATEFQLEVPPFLSLSGVDSARGLIYSAGASHGSKYTYQYIVVCHTCRVVRFRFAGKAQRVSTETPSSTASYGRREYEAD